jgi:hypothetical protein
LPSITPGAKRTYLNLWLMIHGTMRGDDRSFARPSS